MEYSKERWESEGFVHAGHITVNEWMNLLKYSSSVRKLLDDSVEKAGLSRRERHKILRLSRTIADLQGDRDIGINHLTEAISYRQVIPWLRSLVP